MIRAVFPVLVLLTAGLGATELQPAGPTEFRQPQLAAAYGKVAIAYGSGSAIWFASSSDGGATFGPRVKVADIGALALGRHRGPRIVILRDAIVLTADVAREVSKNPKEYGRPAEGELTVWRSVDGGKTWARSGTITDVPAAAKEGLDSVTADSKGNLFAVWLDRRARGAQGVQIYGARSTDEGRTWSKNVLIYASPEGTTCECCDPSVAIDDKGRIHVMFRNVLAGSRDFYLTHSDDGVHFSTPEKLGEGTWKINACPMDGGGIAFDHGQLVTAWRRESEVFIDRPGAPEIPLAKGKDVAIAGGPKGVYLVWSTMQGIEALSPGQKDPVKLSDGGGFPSVVTLPDGTALTAWEQDGSIRVEKLPR